MKFASVFVTNMDGTERLRFDQSLPLLDISGTGMPSIEFVRETPVSGIGQRTYRAIPATRDLVLNCHIPVQRTQDLYLAKRDQILKMFAPKLNASPLVWLYVVSMGGSVFRIPAIYQGGLEFSENGISMGGETLSINLIADDIAWEGTEENLLSSVEVLSIGTWKFPLVIPPDRGIVFGGSGTSLQHTLANYVGSYLSYPTIHLFGSYGVCFIDHVPTNSRIKFDQAISDGQERILDLNAPNGRYVVFDEDGNDRTYELAPNSDLSIAIYPPSYFDETQYINVTFSGNEGDNTAVEISYKNKYIGV